ncbi:MAG: hypothetical protein HYR67_01930, partial [Bacteroidetes bacterium]|nr:hypothetical protein [Bacteroidota bacterium]
MADNQEPEWKDISYLPFIGNLIDHGVKDNEDHYNTLLEAKPKTHVLDDYTIGRVFKIYGEQRDFHKVYEEQIVRWKKLALPNETLNELNRLEKQLEKDLELLNNILSLAEELKKGTIDTILAKDDMDLGFEVLEGKRALPFMDRPGRQGKSEQPSGKLPTVFSAEQLQIASMIDQKVKQILKADGDTVEILREMHDYMPGFKKIMESTTPEEFNELGW